MSQNHQLRTQPFAVANRRTFRQRLRVRRYPVWSAKPLALLSLLAVGLSAAIVYGLGQKSLFIETELTLALIAAGLFLFLTVGLYRGVRVRREQLSPAGSDWSGIDCLDPGGLDLPDIGLDAEGILGAIVAVILAVVAVVLLVIVAWVLLNIVWGLVLVLAMAVFWVFNRALRQVFAHSRQCRGNLAASLGYAALYTTLYTGWLFALVWAINHFVAVRNT